SPSLSMRQTPTTLRNDFGSAPTVSAESSAFFVCSAVAESSSAESARAAHAGTRMARGNFMMRLLSVGAGSLRRPAAEPPGRNDQQRQCAEEPWDRRFAAGDQRIAEVIVAGRRRGNVHAGEPIEQRQDLAVRGRSTGGLSAVVRIFDLAIALVARAAH